MDLLQAVIKSRDSAELLAETSELSSFESFVSRTAGYFLKELKIS